MGFDDDKFEEVIKKMREADNLDAQKRAMEQYFYKLKMDALVRQEAIKMRERFENFNMTEIQQKDVSTQALIMVDMGMDAQDAFDSALGRILLTRFSGGYK